MLIRAVFACFVCMLLFNCERESQTNHNGRLGVNDCISVEATSYKLCLDSIADSRCPTDLVCVWEGNAEAYFVLKKRVTQHTFVLNTYKKFVTDTVIDNLSVKLIEVLPYPKSTNANQQNNYSVKVEITKK